MPLLVRSWNLFHGNTLPPRREDRLREMIELAVADDPDVVCLQEVPAWALACLERWSGAAAVGGVAARPRLGPLPSTAGIGRAITSLDHGLLRSAFTGQANAILVAARHRVLTRWSLVLNAFRFRRAQARWLGLSPLTRLAWAKERRVCVTARLELEDGRTAVVGNLHATGYAPDRRLADAELLRAAVFIDGLARPGELCILAGDFNLAPGRSRTLADLGSAEWGFSQPGPGIDHVLVRGSRAERPLRWPEERRRRGGLLLSDHAPVEVQLA